LDSAKTAVVEGLAGFTPPAGGVILTMGNFDGVHVGHQRLIAAARAAARETAAPVVAVTFEPHPLAIVAPQRTPPRLTTRAEKVALLAGLGVQTVLVLRSDRKLIDTTAEAFLSELVARCRPRRIVEGPTFNFGRGRAGTVDTLRTRAARLGYTLTVVDEVHSETLPGRPAINSSTIRSALRDGRLAEANAMLGRPYRLVGRVGSGHHRGAGLGFPTANLEGIVHLIPSHGVYAAIAQRADGTLYLAAVNIGPQPTFEQSESRVEAFVLDYTGDLHGEPVGLHMLERIRDQVRFADVGALVAQIRRDVERTRTFAPRRVRMRAAGCIPL